MSTANIEMGMSTAPNPVPHEQKWTTNLGRRRQSRADPPPAPSKDWAFDNIHRVKGLDVGKMGQRRNPRPQEGTPETRNGELRRAWAEDPTRKPTEWRRGPVPARDASATEIEN
jgi:hypothetical protein